MAALPFRLHLLRQAAAQVVAARHRLRHKTGLREVAARIKPPIDPIDQGLLTQDQKGEGLANRLVEAGRMVVMTA